MQETLVQFLGRKDPLGRDRLPTPLFLGFPCGSAGKEFACNVGELGSIPGLGGSPGKGKGYPLQYSGLENSMDCIVHGVTELHMTERLSLSLFLQLPAPKTPAVQPDPALGHHHALPWSLYTLLGP